MICSEPFRHQPETSTSEKASVMAHATCVRSSVPRNPRRQVARPVGSYRHRYLMPRISDGPAPYIKGAYRIIFGQSSREGMRWAPGSRHRPGSVSDGSRWQRRVASHEDSCSMRASFVPGERASSPEHFGAPTISTSGGGTSLHVAGRSIVISSSDLGDRGAREERRTRTGAVAVGGAVMLLTAVEVMVMRPNQRSCYS